MIKKSRNKGITLIALIITIIVLLILAGVTLNSLFGQDSIIRKAKEAADKWNNAINEENEYMNFNNSWENKPNEQGIEELQENNTITVSQPEIKNPNGIDLIESSFDDSKLNMVFKEYSAGFEGFNIVLNNLTIGNKYKIEFKCRSNNSYFAEESYGRWFGYKISENQITEYETYTDYMTLPKNREDTEFKTNEVEFTATAQKEYLVFDLAGFLDSTINTFEINDFEIQDITDESNVVNVNLMDCLNIVDRLALINTNGVNIVSEQWDNDKITVEFSEQQAGYEGFNIKIYNLTASKTYRVKFKAKSVGEYFSEESYGRWFGYKISQNPVDDYQPYDNQGYTQLDKSNEYQEYTIDFVATSDKSYLVFNVAGFSDYTTNSFFLKDLEVTENI